MLELKQAPLMVNRSYGAVLKAAYNLLTENFKKTFRHTWIYSLVLSCVLALYFLLSINTINGTNPTYALAVTLLLFIAEILFYARAVMPLNCKSMKWNMLRVLKYSVAFLAVIIVLGCISGIGCIGIIGDPQKPGAMLKLLAYISIATLIITLLLLPYLYVSMKYYMEPETHLRKLMFSGYKTGIRHWGFIFITMLLAVIALACISFVISLPLIIVYAALAFSLQGQVYGDEAGIPEYFNIIAYIAAIITYFVSTFIIIYTLYIGYYIYGTIETREKEKKELAQTTVKA